ncbi:WD repeat-containing protein 46-like protein [Sarcoptes scabiei]|uniref:WD repeat-containing protein 46-like protein n=1 Tax=Sarcoptes scabiei TaxID=52283 RepID=A0A132ACQ0_SARSC|nr:WD repeat-containing protein 46-like protein [Sarcoptes scabiei]
MSVNKIQKISFYKKEREYLHQETSGFLQPGPNESTYQISQDEIVKSLDITSATKYFDLHLPHLGPYKIDYFRSGRNLLLGGRQGHVAVFDWITKELGCEFNVRESVHAVQWLHMPTMFAVAQADWTYVYDQNGTEIHCLKKLYRVYELDFLPYHFLLVSASDNGFLSWLDISTGELVTNFRMNLPRLTCLKHNSFNAITVTGHPNGVVQMWSPNHREPIVKLLCHASTIRDIVIDKEGCEMITTSTDQSIRVWDVRNFKMKQEARLPSIPSKIALSQKNLLAIASANVVNVYKNYDSINGLSTPYMRHRLSSRSSIISSIKFCPYEDVLGIGHQNGFTSVLIPGSGEPNFDAREANPYMTKTQRREMEVKALLDKIDHRLIDLDPNFLPQRDDYRNRPNQIKIRGNSKKINRKSADNRHEKFKNVNNILENNDDTMINNDRVEPIKFDVESFKPNRRRKNKLANRLRLKTIQQEKQRRETIKKKLKAKKLEKIKLLKKNLNKRSKNSVIKENF